MSSARNSKLPTHIAIIMDGNRRWARKHKLSAVAGHDYVAEKALEPLVDRCIELGIAYLTFWAFSTENWERRKHEVEGMMRVFRKGLKRNVEQLFEKGVRLQIIGDIDKFPKDISEQAKDWIKKSENNKAITVCFALNYGGRDELVRVVKRLLKAISNDQFLMSNLTEQSFAQFLDTKGMPDPDLIIRTGGEKRLSGFMSWQSAYSELYFPEVLMPDFTAKELDKAIVEYQKRSRRFGR